MSQLVDPRPRRKHLFNLNLRNDLECSLHEWLLTLPSKRKYLPTIRNALHLWRILADFKDVEQFKARFPKVFDWVYSALVWDIRNEFDKKIEDERKRLESEYARKEAELEAQIATVKQLVGALNSIQSGHVSKPTPGKSKQEADLSLLLLEGDEDQETKPSTKGDASKNLVNSLMSLANV